MRYVRGLGASMTPAEMAAFQQWVSYGDARGAPGVGAASARQLLSRAKFILDLTGKGYPDCIAWVLVNEPDWIIPESPLGRALHRVLQRAELGMAVYRYAVEMGMEGKGA